MIKYSEIDPDMRGVIWCLNQLGLVTTGCCQGHYDEEFDTSPYIAIDMKKTPNLEVRVDNKNLCIYWGRD